MKTIKRSLGTVALATIMILTVSCKDANKKEVDVSEKDKVHQGKMNNTKDISMKDAQDEMAEAILKDYFNLKDALVGDDNNKAKSLGGTLAKSLVNFDKSKYSENQQVELTDIIEDATEHADHISESDIKHQREHFKTLSKDITDMVAITGTSIKLYEQFCPMYDEGTSWISTKSEIRNPYYGSSMLKCGKVKRVIE